MDGRVVRDCTGIDEDLDEAVISGQAVHSVVSVKVGTAVTKVGDQSVGGGDECGDHGGVRVGQPGFSPSASVQIIGKSRDRVAQLRRCVEAAEIAGGEVAGQVGR